MVLGFCGRWDHKFGVLRHETRLLLVRRLFLRAPSSCRVSEVVLQMLVSDKSNRPMDGVGLARRLLDGAAASSFGLQVPLVPLVASLQPVRPGSRPNEAIERGLRVQ